MSHLITINKKGTAVLRPECAQLCPKLKFLDEKELLFVVLAEDYYSLYNQMPEDERRRRAKVHVYGNEDVVPWDRPVIKTAMDEYRSLQYDSRREQLKVYREKMSLINDEIRKEQDPKRLPALITTNKAMRAAIAEIEEEMMVSDEVDANTVGHGVSLLEKLQSNKEKYVSIISVRASS